MNKNILITGTSTGVGFESAILFAQHGHKVYATMRNINKAEELKRRISEEQLNITILALDVTDIASIHAAIDTVIEQDGKIDILLNNAGAGFAKTTESATEEEIKWVTEANYLGVVYCIQAVLPHMRKQRSGHIINITSVGGLVGQPFNELYCGAKFAVEGYTESLATYVTDAFNIKFTNVEPGGIATEFMKSAMGKTIEEGQLASGEYLPIFEKYMSGIEKRARESTERTFQTGLEVAQVVYEVAQSQNPPLRIRTSSWAENFCQLKTQVDPDGTKLVDEVKKRFL